MSEFLARREAGFTLIEMIVVMSVIAVLSAAAILSLAFYIPNLRLKSAAQEMSLQIHKTRLEAIRRGSPVVIKFFVAEPAGTQKYGPVSWVDKDNDSVMDVGEEVLFRMPVEEVSPSVWEFLSYGGVRFDETQAGNGVSFTDNTVVLNSRGMSQEDGSIFLLNARGRTRRIWVTLGGAVRVM